jgi:hypothetical protein
VGQCAEFTVRIRDCKVVLQKSLIRLIG